MQRHALAGHHEGALGEVDDRREALDRDRRRAHRGVRRGDDGLGVGRAKADHEPGAGGHRRHERLDREAGVGGAVDQRPVEDVEVRALEDVAADLEAVAGVEWQHVDGGVASRGVQRGGYGLQAAVARDEGQVGAGRDRALDG